MAITDKVREAGKATQFKKGQSGNPSGRPKSDTLARRRVAKLLGCNETEVKAFDPDEMGHLVGHMLRLNMTDARLIRGNEDATMAELGALSIANRLIKSGDVGVWAQIYELMTGKKLLNSKQEVEVTNGSGSGFTIVLHSEEERKELEEDRHF